MKRILTFITLLLIAAPPILSAENSLSYPKTARFTKEELMDKIKGGWAGQVIGCTYGGPTEFRWQEKMIEDSVKIPWNETDFIVNYMKNVPGLYDDVYMDLTFVGVFDRLGINAPADSLAHEYAHAEYQLWHANQVGRYNYLNGMRPPYTGHWKNNPHADDIDYQIEADFSGLMAPGMPNTASKISDKVGHIMNYGDGWYGGVFVGAMYSLAFISSDINFIITEALKTIPEKSKFHKCITEVIDFHQKNPHDWKAAWKECQKTCGKNEIGCPEGIFRPFNIDAVINSAYIIIGLLYGEGDFTRTIDIATRCGQDSDCNPASAAGILGTAIGYKNIPTKWLTPLKNAEDIDFAYTDHSLNDTYSMGFKQALEVITQNGGKVYGDIVEIKCQKPEKVRFEQSFSDLIPIKNIMFGYDIVKEAVFAEECAAIVINASVINKTDNDYVAELEVKIDGKAVELVKMPADFNKRKPDLYWNYDLKPGKHTFEIRHINPEPGARVILGNAIIYKKHTTASS